MKARTLIALMALFVALISAELPAFSTAAFTSASTNTGTVRAAVDWTPPTVSMVNPGTTIRDTATISANASDAETGIANVVIQYLAAGGSAWTTICTDTTAPYSCAWDTKPRTDGSYSLRAIATDNAAYTTTSDAVSTSIANNFMVALSDPGEVVRGSVPLTATLVNPGLAVYTVRIEYAVAGTGTWRSACTVPTLGPYTCSWVTTGLTNDYYDLRATATTVTGTTTSSAVITDVLVDNLAPTVTMTDPGSPLSGFRTFAATASDAHSGIAQVTIQYTTGTTWSTLCTVAMSPFSCRYNTAQLPDGIYSFRTVAVDAAGNTATSAAITNRRIDNTVSSISMEDPGAFISGIVPLTANAASSAGVTSVRIQVAPTGTTAWTTLCTHAAAPYTCNWNSTSVANGLYDFRAVMVDGTARETVSAVVASRQVDNLPLRGYDIQTTSGSIAGRIDIGDAVNFTYNQQVNLATVAPGWNGSALPVTVRVRDGNILGLGNAGDTLDVLVAGGTAPINLGSVNLRNDYIRSNRTASLTGTMTGATVVVNGVPRSVVTVVISSTSGNLRTATTAGTMVWTPNGAVTDVAGNRTSTSPVTESGVLDRDF